MKSPLRKALRAITGDEAAAGQPLSPLTASDLAEIKEFFPMQKFFVLGQPHSGGGLLARLLSLHPDLHCGSGAHFFTRQPVLTELFAQAEDPASAPSMAALRAMADFLLEREAHRLGKTIAGDQSQNELGGRAVREMHQLFPDASLIQIVRDGRDVLVKQRLQELTGNAAASRRREHSQQADNVAIFAPGWLTDASSHWAGSVSEADRLGHQLYGESYYSLRYEDLLARPFDMLAKVWAFLGLDGDGLEAKVESEIAGNEDVALDRGPQAVWRQFFTPGDKNIFKENAHDALIKWGYESGDDWE
ncbi:MAG: sulfotransferase [Anaerolineales bacterium]|nr:sulfotransferase [Anaerolineales bacterium]